ncbi:TolC family protein [Cyclobacterium jeungdonense]|uniref:TolC family protein n=1 Tax=Cyclobacterium jeungdonense TaxID=708087 RepID=A0ABT8C7K8_9BACT|nr:TolC family protein [Cyclobacterium jeungdonense]MDN3688496.1 TolC family protein [Cyclobacterium jeungdonense]
MNYYLHLFFLLCLGISSRVNAQTDPIQTTGLSLPELVDFALQNSPGVRQSELDQQIGDRQIKSSLSGWLPQISANYQLTNNLKLQTQPIGDELITFGQPFASNLNFSATQTLFDRDQFFAYRGAGLVKEELSQSLETNRINTVVIVSKAYYDILLTYEQIQILDENLARQEKQYQDARSRYEAGLVDKTDFQRARISLANLKSDRNRVNASLRAKYAYLKELAGFSQGEELTLNYAYESLEQKANLEEGLDFNLEQRVEYQLAKTQFATTELNTKYAQWAFIPSLNGFYNYNFLFFNREFSELYSQSFPTSSVGLTIAIPLFQGGKRVQDVKIARLQQDRAELGLRDFERQLYTEYERALANYHSSFYEWETLQSNRELAEEVYETIKLQYDEGVKAYVDLIVAETELRTAQLNHYQALFTVLSSKLDLMRALGQINPSSIDTSL